MKHRVPRKGVILALAVLAVLVVHVAVLHTLFIARVWQWAVIAGIALILAVKVVVIMAHVRKSKKE